MRFKPFKFLYTENIPLRTTADLKAGQGDYFIRQRRNLFSLSVGLIVFEIAGGAITGQSILGGSASVKHPIVIHVALYFALVYFFFRYKLFAPPFWDSLRRDRCNLIMFSSGNAESFQGFLQNKHVLWITGIDEKPKENNEVVLEIKYAFVDPLSGTEKILYASLELRLPVKDYKRMKVSAYIQAWLSTDTFTEVGLPYLLFFIALTLGFLNWWCVEFKFL